MEFRRGLLRGKVRALSGLILEARDGDFFALVAFAILCVLLAGLSTLPAIYSDSGVESFRTSQGIFSELNGMCLKMVFTKPCTPSMWLGSAFLSPVLVSLFLNIVIPGERGDPVVDVARACPCCFDISLYRELHRSPLGLSLRQRPRGHGTARTERKH